MPKVALRKAGQISQDEENAIISQMIETHDGPEAWEKTLRKDPAKLRKLGANALEEDRRGSTRPLDEIL
jgi:hypothetical protein